MDEETIKALAKNLSHFYPKPPMTPPNSTGHDADDWYEYLVAWFALYKRNAVTETVEGE